MAQPHRTRAWITGAGTISAAGIGLPALRTALGDGRTCIREVRVLPLHDVPGALAAEVLELPDLPQNWARRAARSDIFALAALVDALASAGLDPRALDPARTGVAVGSSTGGMLEIENWYADWHAGRSGRAAATRLWSGSVAAPAERVARALGALGPRAAPSTACSTGAVALAIALDWIRLGRADVVIAGGSDALCRMTWSGFHALRSLAPEPCRPFDRNRRGLSLGEGAALLVIEDPDHARARGARPLAELAGAGISCDAHHPTAPRPDGRGAASAMTGALEDAGLDPAAIGYVNAHGTGTPQNDIAEAAALVAVFGDRQPPVSSTKGTVGHLLGAAGALEAVIALDAMLSGTLPSTTGLEDPDPACAIRHVRPGGEKTVCQAVMSNSFGFGGNNCSVVLKVA